MKTCKSCQVEKDESAFYAHPKSADRLDHRCKECVKVAVKANYAIRRPEKSEYERQRARTPERRAHGTKASRAHRARNPERYKARTAVGNALRDGRLTRGPCKHCGSTEKVQAHHHDYNKPLDVEWVCFKCHREQEHGQVVVASP